MWMALNNHVAGSNGAPEAASYLPSLQLTDSNPENPTPNNSTATPRSFSKRPGEMNGYCNLASSPPVANAAVAAGTAEEGKWEGVVVGAATLVRNFSSASQRFRAVERSKSTNGHHGGLQAVVRRAFSMRQPSSFAEGYWRIHDDMDGDAAEQQHQVFEEEEQNKGVEQVKKDAASKEETKRTKKKRGRILKACKKLLRF